MGMKYALLEGDPGVMTMIVLACLLAAVHSGLNERQMSRARNSSQALLRFVEKASSTRHEAIS